jgi:hypothetical protein
MTELLGLWTKSIAIITAPASEVSSFSKGPHTVSSFFPLAEVGNRSRMIKLVLSKGHNRVGVSLPLPEIGNRS